MDEQLTHATDHDRYGCDPTRSPSTSRIGSLTSSSINDSNFEVSGVRETMATVATVYKIHGVVDACQANHPDAWHSFLTGARDVAYSFIEKWLGKPGTYCNS